MDRRLAVPTKPVIVFVALSMVIAQSAAQLELKWSDRIIAPTGGADPYATCKDASGNLYVAGGYSSNWQSLVVAKYSASGQKLWSTVWSIPDTNVPMTTQMTVDVTGNVFIAGTRVNSGSANGGTLIKFDSTGSFQWIRNINPFNWSAQGSGVSTDIDGNSYLTGAASRTGNGQADLYIAKYSSNGNLLFSDVYDGPVHKDDSGRGVLVNSDGSFIVYGNATSESSSNSSVGSTVLIKYDQNYNREWIKTYQTPGLSNALTAAKLDSGNNIIGVGFNLKLVNLGLVPNALVIKFDQFGDLIWATQFNGATGTDGFGDPVESEDYANALTFDSQGNILVAGRTQIAKMHYDDVLLLKVAPTGELLFSRSYSPGLTQNEVGWSVDTDRYDNIYVGAKGYLPHVMLRYSKEGTLAWLSTQRVGNSTLFAMHSGSIGDIFSVSGDGGIQTACFLTASVLSPLTSLASYQAQLTGTLANLSSADGQYVELRQDPFGPRSWVDFGLKVETILPTTEVFSLVLDLRTQATASGVSQRIYLYDFTAGQYVLIDDRLASLSFTNTVLEVNSQPERFVDPVSRKVEARVAWFNPAGFTASRWWARADLLNIRVRS